MPQALYDKIGTTYTSTRRPDPRISGAIARALRDARTVLNIGAGAGAYEPSDRRVIAVEPSAQMIRQRGPGTGPVIKATSEVLPFRDRAFDAALALLTLHHWTDWRRGLDEMRRVADRVVIFTFEPAEFDNFWLTQAYFPEIVEMDRRRCPSVAALVRQLGQCTVDRIPIPGDCVDGFLAAYWRRPQAYLDPEVRAGISSLALLDSAVVARGVARLEADLESGAWEQRFGHVRRLDALDVGYRLLAASRRDS
jgi:SAM-dependent methyltransferase